MTTFEEHADWMAEYLNGLGYYKVIRCKECKKFSKGTLEGRHICLLCRYPVTANDYCSHAERRGK